MTALFVNQLTTLDFSFLCPNRGLVGETWLVDVELFGDLDEQGMVFDFGHVKKQVKASLDLLADHRLLVPTAHPSVEVKSSGNRLEVRMTSSMAGTIECKAPAQAMLLVDAKEISIPVLTHLLEQSLLKGLPDNVSKVSLRLYTESIDGAYYHYSHGLKKHLGNCQRIAHGHRSGLRIEVDGQHAPQFETRWATLWRDIYIATEEDLLDSLEDNGDKYYRFGYTSQQGYFELTIAARRCYLISTDTTVELLAQHMAQTTYEWLPDHAAVVITAFEGVNKGAIAEFKRE